MTTVYERSSTIDLGMLARILEDTEMRFQDPKIEKHGRAKKVWRIRPFVNIVKPDGTIERQRKPIVLGQCATMTAQQAKVEKQKVMATLNAGKLVVQAQLTFDVVIEKFVAAHLPTMGSATQAKYRTHIDNHIRPAFGPMKIMDIDKPTVQAWLNAKHEAGLSHATRCDLRAILSNIFMRAQEWRMWDGISPCIRLKLIGSTKAAREKRVLTDVEFSRFLDAIPETRILSAAKCRLMVCTALMGGLRVSEVLGLQARDVDVTKGTATIARRFHRGDVAAPKTESSAVEVDLGIEIATQLAALGTSDQWLFARPDSGELPDDRDLQQYVFRPALEAAGCYQAGMGFHTFRRMMITLSQQSGATPVEAMKLGRHSDLSMVARYTVIESSRRATIVNAMAARLSGGRVQ